MQNYYDTWSAITTTTKTTNIPVFARLHMTHKKGVIITLHTSMGSAMDKIQAESRNVNNRSQVSILN
jgi:hypothetical protein